MNYPEFTSKLLENTVEEFAKLPGIGRKTALRLALYLLRQDKNFVTRFGETIIKMRNEIKNCKICMVTSDTDVCQVCSDSKRDRSVICVVENIRDVILIESTQLYRGMYHVLGGIISPMNGIGPKDLHINELEERLKNGEVKELIIALSTTMEGDTTGFYLYKRLSPANVLITTIARGVSVGDELEYTDEITLGRSIINRMPFKN
jgi:recombination protein RecR